jgi:hypothetical protein
VAFIEKFVVVPKGDGARRHMKVPPWQQELISGVFDPPRPRLGLWSLPRSSGKSSLAVALGLYGLHGDDVEGAHEVVVAADERQAGIVFRIAARMTELTEPPPGSTRPPAPPRPPGPELRRAATPPEPALATCLPACAGSACPRAQSA